MGDVRLTGPEANQSEGEVKHVCVLPYAGLDRVDVVGPFHFWPWRQSGLPEKYIPNDNLRNRVLEEVNRHVNWSGMAIHTQCLVSIQEQGRLRLAALSDGGLSEAVNLLAFAYLLPFVDQSPPVPEHFRLYNMPLCTGGRGVSSGGLHNLLTYVSNSVGLRLQSPLEVDGCGMRQRSFVLPGMPAFCEGISQTLPDQEILDLGQGLLSALGSEQGRRAFESLRWHNLALRQQELEYGVRAIALATAFEILFDVGNKDQKNMRICQEVDRLLGQPSGPRWKVRKSNPAYSVTRNSYVTHKLYRWRNKVVHGASVKDRDFTLRARGWGRKSLVLIASRIFGRCFKAIFSAGP